MSAVTVSSEVLVGEDFNKVWETEHESIYAYQAKVQPGQNIICPLAK
jgi:hypothetical protein